MSTIIIVLLVVVTDFTNNSITVTVPAATTPGPQSYTLPKFFSVIDDDIDEVEQSFALVAEIGSDVTNTCYFNGAVTECSCFQYPNSEGCHGRRGVTEIRIIDNDGKGITVIL